MRTEKEEPHPWWVKSVAWWFLLGAALSIFSFALLLILDALGVGIALLSKCDPPSEYRVRMGQTTLELPAGLIERIAFDDRSGFPNVQTDRGRAYYCLDEAEPPPLVTSLVLRDGASRFSSFSELVLTHSPDSRVEVLSIANLAVEQGALYRDVDTVPGVLRAEGTGSATHYLLSDASGRLPAYAGCEVGTVGESQLAQSGSFSCHVTAAADEEIIMRTVVSYGARPAARNLHDALQVVQSAVQSTLQRAKR